MARDRHIDGFLDMDTRIAGTNITVAKYILKRRPNTYSLMEMVVPRLGEGREEAGLAPVRETFEHVADIFMRSDWDQFCLMGLVGDGIWYHVTKFGEMDFPSSVEPLYRGRGSRRDLIFAVDGQVDAGSNPTPPVVLARELWLKMHDELSLTLENCYRRANGYEDIVLTEAVDVVRDGVAEAGSLEDDVRHCLPLCPLWVMEDVPADDAHLLVIASQICCAPSSALCTLSADSHSGVMRFDIGDGSADAFLSRAGRAVLFSCRGERDGLVHQAMDTLEEEGDMKPLAPLCTSLLIGRSYEIRRRIIEEVSTKLNKN